MTKPGALLPHYRSLLPYLARYRRRYILGLVCLIAVDAAQIAIPQFIRRAIDLVSSGVFSWKQIIILCLWMTAMMAFISLGRFFWRYFIHGSSRRIETEMRERLFGHLQTLSWDFYQKNKIGDLMARSTNDLNAVRMAVGMGLVALVDFVVMASAILVIIFVQDARSALVSILPLPLITILILLFGRTVGKKFQTAQETYSKMSDTVQETFSGLRVVKSFVKEWWFIKKFAADNDDYRAANMELVRLFGFFFPLVTFLSGFTILLMLVIGGIRVVNGLMSPGSLVAMFRYLNMLIWPLMGAGFMVNLIQRGAVSLGRVNDILNTVPSIRDGNVDQESGIRGIVSKHSNLLSRSDNKQQPSVPIPAAIEIKGLNFSYSGEEKALENISLTVGRGEWLGLMGKTGSGKSTLIKVLTRMVESPPGTVMVFGCDIRERPLADLRRLFAVSPQDSYLFSDSIQNNIGYGIDSPGEALLEKAAFMAALERDFAGFTDGKDTLIGERGLTLSGGQKQRVAIARAMIMDSEILILDDSLSAVDAGTERKILDCMRGVHTQELATRGSFRAHKKGMYPETKRTFSPTLPKQHTPSLQGGVVDNLLLSRKGRTTIFISHRVSTLRYADKVLVLDRGRQSEYGSPRELALAGGFYSRMAAIQRFEKGEV